MYHTGFIYAYRLFTFHIHIHVSALTQIHHVPKMYVIFCNLKKLLLIFIVLACNILKVLALFTYLGYMYNFSSSLTLIMPPLPIGGGIKQSLTSV